MQSILKVKQSQTLKNMATHVITLPTIDQVNFELIAHEEHVPVKGNAIASGDAKYDARVENKIIKQLDSGNIWAWCTVEVRGTYKGITESDYLGCCSYKSEKDFKKDLYYLDMQRECFNRILENLRNL